MSESSPEIQLQMDRGRLRDALLQRAMSPPLLLVLATYIVLALFYQLAVPWACRLDEPWHTAYSANDPVKLGRSTVRPATALAIQESAPRIVRDWHCFFPPPDQDFARVEVRLYDPSTMERLVAYDGDGKRLPNGASSPEIHL